MKTKPLLEVPPSAGKTLVDYHRHALDDALNRLWECPWAELIKGQLEPIVRDLLSSGDIFEANEALVDEWESILWANPVKGLEVRAEAEGWLQVIYDRWSDLNHAEVEEYKRQQKGHS
jgi:hypothetical protein